MKSDEWPTREALFKRYEEGCRFTGACDYEAVENCLAQFYKAIALERPRFVRTAGLLEFSRAAWAAWAAWAARAARAARAAWAARDARAARAAWAAWAARAAWAAWDARAARDARDARDAWDASYCCVTYLGAVEMRDALLAEIWRPVFESFEAGLWGMVPADKECVWIQKPAIYQINGRLHRETGPAFELPETKIWYWRGVEVPQYVVENPHSITVQDIETEKNVEVRRVKIERYGQARYLVDAGAEKIHRDDFGTLYRRAIPDDEPMVMVKVVNSTPERDGSFKDYFLRVPPNMRTARQAVAWTFGLAEDEYAPAVQT